MALRKIIAPQCKTQLGREILGSDHYVDDVLLSHNDAEELFIAMKNLEQTLEKNGSTIKKIISNELSYHVEKIIVTKQVLARLAGQAYQISGSFLDPMLIGLKILFSQSCKLAKNWTEVIQDEEFVLSIKTFLSIIQKTFNPSTIHSQ